MQTNQESTKKVSIIIPVREINDYIIEAIPHHLALDYEDFEILIFPNEASDKQFDKTRIISSGDVGPAIKRDMAIEHATGSFFAFIDDDAYPRSDWLKNAVKELEPDDVGAVGGPAVTAPGDSFMQQAGGKVFESMLCSSKYAYRYIPRKRREDDDIPSVNLIVKREVFEKIGGFDSSYWPGEDTKLCLDIVYKLGKKIIYNPDILVYHHRRSLFKEHLKQSNGYARHRGYFARKLPQTSLRLQYFIPSLFTLGVFLGPAVCLFVPILWWVYAGVMVLYFILAILSIRGTRSVALILVATFGIFATHIGYGFNFIRGLLSKKMIR
ncbi:MAG: glycosyltransferase [Oscillospiraceae bacterium]|jgi:GT2 family glycosyltransferase|nr:glycosyltransferase [Oscillospiraceae bacterium]